MSRRERRKLEHSSMLIVYRDALLIAVVCLIYLATYIDARAGHFRIPASINALSVAARTLNGTKTIAYSLI